MRNIIKTDAASIVCYGDSNTRFYLGDKQCSGDIELSYPMKLQKIFADNGYSGVKIYNCGYPDMQSDWAVDHFAANVTQKHADICILGFGTNNIRQPNADLSTYISQVNALFSLCKNNKIVPMSLLIPWFDEEYAGKAAQDSIEAWNNKLTAVCAQFNAETFDVYNAFKGEPDKYFNEKQTPRRHYSALATDAIARMVFERLTAVK